MKFLNRKTNIDFMSQRNIALVFSAILIIASITSLAVRGLNFGLDFTGGTLIEVGYPSAPDTTEVRDNLDFARSLGRGGLVQGMMTPHAADTHTPRTLAAIASAAAELGTGVHTHLSQGARETETIRRRWGRTPTQWLSEAGLLEGPFFGAHFTAPDWDVDAPILRDAGA